MYYIHPDYLGSFNLVTNASGGMVQEIGFDAWGRQRNAGNWTYSNLPAPKFERGYTGHEYLAGFDLVNMNGRVYDPMLGRFLSPDPTLQAPSNLQDYNRYSYVLNNPLKYTDPTGYQLYSYGTTEGSAEYIGSGSVFGIVSGGGGSGSSTPIGLDGVYYDGDGYSTTDGFYVPWEYVSQIIAKYKYYEGQSTYIGHNGFIRDPSGKIAFYSVVPPINVFASDNSREASTAANGGDDFANSAGTITRISDVSGIVVSTSQGIIQNTRIGADIAYAISGNSGVINGVTSVLKYTPYVGLFVTAGTGYYLSKTINPLTNQPYQPWGETGTDIAANIGTIYIGTQYGGFYGAAAAAFYLADKAAFKAYINGVREHPDWVLPASFHSFAH